MRKSGPNDHRVSEYVHYTDKVNTREAIKVDRLTWDERKLGIAPFPYDERACNYEPGNERHQNRNAGPCVFRSSPRKSKLND